MWFTRAASDMWNTLSEKLLAEESLAGFKKLFKNTPIQVGIFGLKHCEPFSKVETALYTRSFCIIIMFTTRSNNHK